MKGRPEVIDIDISRLNGIIERASEWGALRDEERDELKLAIETLLFLTQELEKKRVSIKRLKKMLFGDTTEKTSALLDKLAAAVEKGDAQESEDKGAHKSDSTGGDGKKPGAADKEKPRGHGRNGASKYEGAQTVQVPHESLKPKQVCPECAKGKVYAYTSPGILVRLTGYAPIGGRVYELQRLRCNLCGQVFTAAAPEGVGEEKYDATSGSIIALLKYGCGMAFNRLQRLQQSLGIPLPASTQWEIVADVAQKVEPAMAELIRQAAQGDVLHHDDTTMKILELADAGNGPPQPSTTPSRKGVFTSGVVSVFEDHKIALFFTGREHAGENLAKLLAQRDEQREAPIQMCDALSRNMSEDLNTIVANCMAHGRRQFVDVAENFPEECLHVLKLFKVVYKNDDLARQNKMAPQERLLFHQEYSAPPMKELEKWCETQFKEHLVEPNSGLGKAISYMQNHWQELTLFLREPGAPLDNNICERALKKAILNRKNAYFYKTENSARVGDLFMSLIHTCELCQANPFDYLTELQKHAPELAAAPQHWMPWNYKETLAQAPG
jgi:transposase